MMCCYLPLIPTLGGAKGYMDVARNYRRLGHIVDLVGADEIVGADKPFMDEEWRVLNYPEKLKSYLLKNGDRYDVVEFESIYLPFSMEKTLSCLLVARCSLLDIHLRDIKIPRFGGWRSIAGILVKGWVRKKKLNNKIVQVMQTLRHADLINVQNPTDKEVLIKNGIEPNKIIFQPLALFQERFECLSHVSDEDSHKTRKMTIAFVGTFDPRKGAVEFPTIIKKLIKIYPNVHFKLMGVLGMFPSAESIQHYIGEEYTDHLEIVGRFKPEELPALLQTCSLGIFPSYLESFGYGVLEMMAAGLPVVGYRSPGISMLLLEKLTVSPGNVEQLILVLKKLIDDAEYFQECRISCREKALKFVYENQSKNDSIEKYHDLIKSRKK